MMDERPFDLALAGQVITALPDVIVEALKASIAWTMALGLIALAIARGDLFLGGLAFTAAVPLLFGGFRQLEVSWAAGGAKITALRPPAPPRERVLIWRGNGSPPPAAADANTVAAEDVHWLTEGIYCQNWNWARRSLVQQPPTTLPSGRALDESEYDRLIAALESLGLLTGRGERDKGELTCKDWDEARVRLETIS